MYEDFISERLTALRLSKNISARDMSLSIGQNENYINRIESKKAMPSMQGFFYICEFLKISPMEFFDSGIRNPEKVNDMMEDLKMLNDEQLAAVTAVVKGFRKYGHKKFA